MGDRRRAEIPHEDEMRRRLHVLEAIEQDLELLHDLPRSRSGTNAGTPVTDDAAADLLRVLHADRSNT